MKKTATTLIAILLTQLLYSQTTEINYTSEDGVYKEASRIYIGFRNGNSVERFGYSHSIFQHTQ